MPSPTATTGCASQAGLHRRTLHTELTIAAAEPDPRLPGHGRVVESCRVVTQQGETVRAAEHILLVARRPDAITG